MRSRTFQRPGVRGRGSPVILGHSRRCTTISTKCATVACLNVINMVLVAGARATEDCMAEPNFGITDSLSVKTTEAGGPCNYYTCKKIRGRKRKIVTDTAVNLLNPANLRLQWRAGHR